MRIKQNDAFEIILAEFQLHGALSKVVAKMKRSFHTSTVKRLIVVIGQLVGNPGANLHI